MRIGILGPFDVVQDGAVTTPSAPKLRTVLALLAVNANSTVPTQQLIDELWGSRPPESATTTLQTYIYQLRKQHGLYSSAEAGKVPALVTAANGYQLALPADALDSAQFTQLVERGRGLVQAGEPAAASAVLREALALWRGTALEDAGAGAALQAAGVWLAEMRKSVTELRVDLDLQLGRHYELVGELTSLVAHDPTYEGFQASLMLALYRCGRRSDALQVYHRARQALASELGLSPSRRLQELHGAVLAADPSLDLSTPEQETVVRAHGSAAPNQLPPSSGELVERADALVSAEQSVLAAPSAPRPVLVVVGAPGSGKSAFGVEVARQLTDAYPDGQFYAKLIQPDNTPVTPADVLGGFLREIGVAESRIPDSPADRHRMFREWASGHRILFVLDDVSTMDQVRAVVPDGGTHLVIAVSRRRLSDPSIVATVALSPLSTDGALRMIGDAVGRTKLDANRESLRRLVELCDGLPLAIRQAIALLQLRPHWSVRRLVRHLKSGLTAAHQSADIAGLLDSVQRTHRLMRREAREAFQRLVHAPQPLSVPGAAALMHVADGTAELLLEELVEFQLAEVDEPGAVDTDDFHYRFRRALSDVAVDLARDGAAPQPRTELDRIGYVDLGLQPA